MISSSSESVDLDGGDEETVGAEFKEEVKSEDESHNIPSSWSAGTTKAAADKNVEDDSKPWVPVRVSKALKQAKNFSEFKALRPFTFLPEGFQLSLPTLTVALYSDWPMGES